MAQRKIKVIEVTSELGAGTRGSSLGPSALKFADQNKGRRRLSKLATSKVSDLNYILNNPSPLEYGKHIDSIAQIVNSIALEVEKNLSEEYFPLIISADHSNAAGTIAGIKNYYTDKRLGVIWIDAHADMHTPYTTPSGNVHGMPLAASLGLDNKEMGINEPDETTIECWDEIKYAGSHGILPKILPQDLVFIDIRDLERQEWELIESLNIEFYTPKEVKDIGIVNVAKEALEYLKDCDIIYISFDVDSMDPTVSHGTGTPYPDGLQLHEAKTLLYHLMKHPKTIALEITEINPLLDVENKMAKTVLEILEEFL